MNQAEAAQARHNAYRLFSRLYREGATAVLHPTIQQIPELAPALSTPFDADETAAAHHTLFRFNLFPFESIFLGSDGLLGGDITQGVVNHYQRSGFPVSGDDTSPDHVGIELAYLAFLSGAESDAWEDNLAPTAVRLQRHQSDFLQTHLLRWLPPLIVAIRQQGGPFFTAVADLTLSLVTDHYQTLRNNLDDTAVHSWQLPPAPDLLNDEKTGLKQIAAFLVTPVHSGLYLSRDDVGQLARRQELPRGFGDRQQLLLNLLRAAVQYEQLPHLLDALIRLVQTWQAGYRSMVGLASFTAVWQTKLTQTMDLLRQIQTSVISNEQQQTVNE